MKCFISGFENRGVRRISFVCNNCSSFSFDCEDIDALYMDDIYILREGVNLEYMNHCDKLYIVVKEDKLYKQDDNAFQLESFDDKLKAHSICQANIYFTDGCLLNVILPFNDMNTKTHYNYLEKYYLDSNYLFIKVERKNLMNTSVLSLDTLVSKIRGTIIMTTPLVKSAIIFGDYATTSYNSKSVIMLYVCGNIFTASMLQNALTNILHKDVLVFSSDQISLDDKIFKNKIIINI